MREAPPDNDIAMALDIPPGDTTPDARTEARARWSFMLQTKAREAPKRTNEEKDFLIRYD
jgi:hypothetical protein